MNYQDRCEISDMIGKVPESIDQTDDVIRFKMKTGEVYTFLHEQDCCEGVSIEDVNGDWKDLINYPLEVAEERSNRDTHPEGKEHRYEPDSFTYTYYTFRSLMGTVTVRWFGESNGYYGESVDLYKVKE